MPYIQQWVEPKKDPKLKVHPDLPDGYSEVKGFLSRDYKHATLGGKAIAVPSESLHYCSECKGWIEGHPNDYQVNTLSGRHLAGRRGTEYHCARCGHKIGFFGVMS